MPTSPSNGRDGERELFWVLDDLHCPNPLSPMFFDIGGWWLTCDHMFRRFGTPFASDWIAKEINGYLYTAAIPAEPGVRGRGRGVQRALRAARPRRRRRTRAGSAATSARVLPHYATSFMDWWRDRLRPEIERNFAYLDGFDMEGADLIALAVLLEEAIDIHDRHWKIHWMINFAAVLGDDGAERRDRRAQGGADAALPGRLQSSVADRNWDSIEALWQMKEEIKGDAELQAAFARRHRRRRARRARCERARRAVPRASASIRTASEFGRKAVWSHEFVFPTWFENPAPIVEAVRGYLETDYDYPADARGRARRPRRRASPSCSRRLPRAPRATALRATLELSLGLNPLTPDHHFYIDQGTNARLRLVLVAIGRKLAAAGRSTTPRT